VHRGQSATVNLDGGVSGNPRNRFMVGPDQLTYQLYRDAALQDPIDTAFWTWRLRRSENTGEPVTFTAYGQIPAGQGVAAGTYVDTIRVTVIY
jgi:spore coat protein U-like protein